MKKAIIIFLGIILFVCGYSRADQWRIHSTFAPYLERIIDTPKYTYILTRNQPYYDWSDDYSMVTNSLFRYDKSEKETLGLSIQNLQSSPMVSTAEYDFKNKFLMVAYTDGNIDLIYDNGEVKNIPGLKVTEGYSKGIHSITMDPSNDRAWLATDFGYVAVNTKKGEISSSRNFDKKALAVASFDDKIYIGDSSGLYVTDSRSGSSMTRIGDVENVVKFVIYGDRLYMRTGTDIGATVSYISKGDPDNTLTPIVNTYITDLEAIPDGIIVNTPGEIWMVHDNLTTDYYLKPTISHWKHTSGIDGRNFWVDCGLDGVVKIEGAPLSQEWKENVEKILPNAANCYIATSMAYSPTYGMLVRNHGVNQLFTAIDPITPDYLSGLKNMEWKALSATVKTPDYPQFSVGQPNGVAIDPRDPDMVYCGSVKSGILGLNLADPTKSVRLSRTTDPSAGQPGFIPFAEPSQAVPEYTPFSEAFFDSYGNLWSQYYYLDERRSELWYWTPEARKGTTSASNYKPFKKIPIKDFPGAISVVCRPLMVERNKNKIVSLTQNNKNLVIYDHNGTLENLNDDKQYHFSETIYDQDGSAVNFVNYVSLFEDPLTGNVWLGTTDGVFHFNPSTVSESKSTKVNRVKVARNDGTNYADYLLDGVQVNAIASDGQGRKWFGTNGGGLVCTSSTGAEIIKIYSTDNSLLPNNTIYSLCYNPDNNSMMVSTLSGLAELYLSASSVESDDTEAAVVYPNPVRPDFYGYVSIEGLEDNALVKIMDSAGNLIKELDRASQGITRWDVTNLHNKRVRSGVYYVLASGTDEGSGYAAVAKILVVN